MMELLMVKLSLLKKQQNSYCRFVFRRLESEDCDIMKRSLCSDLDVDEYSVRATRTLYIGNLQSEISYNELRETYSAYGDIIVCEKVIFLLLCIDKTKNLFLFLKIGIGN